MEFEVLCRCAYPTKHPFNDGEICTVKTNDYSEFTISNGRMTETLNLRRFLAFFAFHRDLLENVQNLVSYDEYVLVEDDYIDKDFVYLEEY